MKLTISLDTELGASSDTPKKIISRGRRGRKNIEKFLELFQSFGIHATWAFQGKLLLNREKYEDLNPANKINKKFEDYFFAPEIVQKVMDCPVKQEIASHGFNHINYFNSSFEEVNEDLELSLFALKQFGLSPESFVFPWNSYNSAALNLVASYGFKTIRIPYSDKKPNQALNYSRHFVGVNANTPLQFLLTLFDNLKETDSIFHIYTHPEDFHNFKSFWIPLLEKAKTENISSKIKSAPYCSVRSRSCRRKSGGGSTPPTGSSTTAAKPPGSERNSSSSELASL